MIICFCFQDNIADLPSREEYQLLRSLGAQWVKPRLHKRFLAARSWEALRLRGVIE